MISGIAEDAGKSHYFASDVNHVRIHRGSIKQISLLFVTVTMLATAMKVRLLTLLLVLGSLLTTEAAGSFINLWFDGKKLLESGDRVESTAKFRECYEGAIEAANANYAWPAADRTASGYYSLGDIDEAGLFAQKALVDLSRLEEPNAVQCVIVRVSLLTMVERRHQNQGRIGEAWRTVRLASAALRGQDPTSISDAPVLKLEEVDKLLPAYQGYAYRLIERNADYLDLTGRSDESLELLASASAQVKSRWDRLPPQAILYAAKIRAGHINMLDFLGYKEEAIKQLQALLEDTLRVPSLKGYHANQKLNLLRHVSQWEGPSEEILEQVREAAEIHKKYGPQFAKHTDQFVAKMEMDLHRSKEAMEKLVKSLADARRRGNMFDALYHDRDQITAKIRLGEVIDDSVFISQLDEARRQGNKRAEPTLYTIFANHLVDQGRMSEAMLLYREALRMVRSFGRPMHQFEILCGILDASVLAGDKRSIQEAYDELVKVLASAKDRPDYRLAQIALTRAYALVALDRSDEARVVLEEARKQTKDLPEWMVRFLRPEITDQIFAPAATVAAEKVKSVVEPIEIQPIEVVSMVAPGVLAETRLTIENPRDAWVSGHLVAVGPGAVFNEGTLELNASQPVATVKLALEIPAGNQYFVPCYAAGASNGTSLKVDFRWSDPETEPSTWEVQWKAAAADKIVLDASLLGSNPFRSLLLYHQLNLPEGMDDAPFRMIAPQPMRIEYYDADKQRLLGIDANGNGDFAEVGDFLCPAAGDVQAVWIGKDTGRMLEVRIFGVDGKGISLKDGPVILRAESMKDGKWEMETENVLRNRVGR